VTLLRNIVADLVEKRLWPVAVVLLAALVGVPLVLGSGREPDPVPPPAAAAGGQQGEPAAIVATEATGRRDADGPRHDPFRRRSKPTTTTPDGGGGTASATTAGGGGTGGAGAPSDGAPAGARTTAGAGRPDEDTAPSRDVWRVDVRFGRDGDVRARNDLPRLSPLPDEDDPFLIFLGVQADGRTALFLVSSDAEVTGDGRCLPSRSACERVEMRAGQTVFFDVATEEGRTVQYELDLVRIVRETKADPAVARAARARESAAGRRVLRRAVRSGQVEVSDLTYSRKLGLLVPTGRDASRRGALFGGYRVDLRFGPPDALVKRYNLARLTPLPSVEEPSFVYLGVLSDGRTALFLNPSEAPAAGDAVCEPGPHDCQRVTLRAGQRATFAAPTIGGQTREYELVIDRIEPVRVTTEPAARRARRRESPAGRVILRRLIREVGGLIADLSFSVRAGVIERVLQAAAAAHAAGPAPDPAPAGAADADRAAQAGDGASE
jgi:hypothetical protein